MTHAASTSPLGPAPVQHLSPGVSREALPLRGRDEIAERLTQTFDDSIRGGVRLTILSGRPGIGKTRLLREALDEADHRGWRSIVAAPDEDSLTTPLGALTNAALSSTPPLLDAEALAPVLIGSHPQYWITRLLNDAIEIAAKDTAVLVVVDDLQWLDAGSLGALSALVRTTFGMPVNWLLATRPGTHQAAHGRLLDQARGTGQLIEVPPLSEGAIDEIGTDVLGHPAGPTLSHALAGTEGNPLLALELLYGLEDEQLITVVDGSADVIDDRLPRGFGASSRRRLAALSRPALRLAQVGSLFGRHFSLSAALSVIGTPPGAAASAVEELIDNDIVADEGDELVFRHDTIREAASETLTPSLRKVLGREVVERRLDDGTPAAVVASELLRLAEPGDPSSIDLLISAARELASTDAHTAATLISRAASLAPANARCAAEIVELLPTLWAGGRGDEVASVGEKFSSALRGDERARVDLAVARLLTESSFEDAIRTCERALQIPGVAASTRVELLAVRTLNYANKADWVGLRASIAEGRAEADDDRDRVALATLDACESVLTFYESRFDDALALQRDALRRIADSGARASLWLPEGLWMAFMHNSMGECRRALAEVDAGLADARRAHSVIAEAYWMMLRARVLYDLGVLDEARAQSEAVLDLASELQLGDFANATAGIVLFRIALHIGDVALLEQTRPLVSALADGVGLTRTGRWNLAVEALESGRFSEALGWCDLALASFEEATPSMTTPADFLDDVMLTEICIGARDTASIVRIERVVTERAAANRSNRFVGAVSSAVHGLVARSETELVEAATVFRAGERPLVLAHVLEVLASVTVEDRAAVEALEEALALYETAGATRDASRVLRSLRSRGVHRRLKSVAAGAHGLSRREQQVAEVLLTGATTKQISDALLLSPHTVVTHIRHIFAKLGVNTRNEVIEILGS
ncbi:AAA family ATPase [Microbacterium sp. SLBN-146]|uniref:helix-turn-helix transcriptional regulator n=1 Tax=Microbacterium sp. SLBN-146 TaxID=2768457 RepID=UPI001356E135|nr:AAA family ATPase [Microbacterium sp. SLBN-146]